MKILFVFFFSFFTFQKKLKINKEIEYKKNIESSFVKNLFNFLSLISNLNNQEKIENFKKELNNGIETIKKGEGLKLLDNISEQIINDTSQEIEQLKSYIDELIKGKKISENIIKTFEITLPKLYYIFSDSSIGALISIYISCQIIRENFKDQLKDIDSIFHELKQILASFINEINIKDIEIEILENLDKTSNQLNNLFKNISNFFKNIFSLLKFELTSLGNKFLIFIN